MNATHELDEVVFWCEACDEWLPEDHFEQGFVIDMSTVGHMLNPDGDTDLWVTGKKIIKVPEVFYCGDYRWSSLDELGAVRPRKWVCGVCGSEYSYDFVEDGWSYDNGSHSTDADANKDAEACCLKTNPF